MRDLDFELDLLLRWSCNLFFILFRDFNDLIFDLIFDFKLNSRYLGTSGFKRYFSKPPFENYGNKVVNKSLNLT